ncbi:hypothetical protein ACUXV3_04995 [Roseobacteraceae bacterium NS-SX3]
MKKLPEKLRQGRLVELMRVQRLAKAGVRRPRVSRRSEGEGAEVLVLRDLAARSLQVPHNRPV